MLTLVHLLARRRSAFLCAGVVSVLAFVGCGAEGEGRGDASEVSADSADSGSETRDGADHEAPLEDVCAPDCPEARCGSDDGCGGLCGPCPTEVSCEECPLVLRVVERTEKLLKLALDFAPAEGAALPTLADVRLEVDGNATLLELEVGEPISAAGKTPFPDPDTGEPWQVLDDGTVRVSVGSTAGTEEIGGGRWLVYRFRLGGAFEPLEGPVVFRLSTAEAIFAPPPAAAQLWGEPLDDPVVIWP